MKNQTRTIAYHPEFKTIAGSTSAALLLSQFWYWSQNKTVIRRKGQFFKTQKEISQETGLSRSQYETAVKRLEDNNIIEKELKGWPRKTWIKVNLGYLLTELEKLKSSLVEAVQKVIKATSGIIKKAVKSVAIAKKFTATNDAKPMATRINIPDPEHQYCADD